MSYEFRFDSKKKSTPPFNVDLSCNISIDVNVAMRLGELIKASKTEDKQLLALGHKLSFSMKQLVDGLDDRQWDALCSYMEEQSSGDDPRSNEFDEGSNYADKARKVVSNDFEKYEEERPLKNFMR